MDDDRMFDQLEYDEEQRRKHYSPRLDRDGNEIGGYYPMFKKNHKSSEQAEKCPNCGKQTYQLLHDGTRACQSCHYTDAPQYRADVQREAQA